MTENSDNCPGCRLLREWNKTAWARGHLVGMAENARIARDAEAALAAEKQAHADTNARMTEELMAAEAEIERLKAERELPSVAR